jgi:hypothetical protein
MSSAREIRNLHIAASVIAVIGGPAILIVLALLLVGLVHLTGAPS